MTERVTIAAVDLGSNSFRLQVARVADDHIYPLDSLKESVRLAAGLTPQKTIDIESQERALACLARFGERLRSLPQDAVRVVGTNTLRVAKNADAFLQKAQTALGFPIEIISGHEEARLIYLGVSHSLSTSSVPRLVVDIGGGSTEFIIGTGLNPIKVESLYMGCVSYSRNFFPDGKITEKNMRAAELAAGSELLTIASGFSPVHWTEAIGSSGTARALSEILEQNGYSESGITAKGLAKLRAALVKAGDYRLLKLAGLREDRAAIIAGGLAIMSALFGELDINQMTISDSGLREGIMYDMLGRLQHHDIRDATVSQFMTRYGVDMPQASRVEALSQKLYKQLVPDSLVWTENARQELAWASRLHEIGLSISYSGFHKHSAYIIESADMPGFSKREQGHLGLLALAQRGSLSKAAARVSNSDDWAMILALRLATLFYRGRTDIVLPEIRLHAIDNGFEVCLEKAWVQGNPLTEVMLQSEVKAWKSAGLVLQLQQTVGKGVRVVNS